MHPEILWELNAQRGREMRAQARQAKLARMAARSRRRGRDRVDAADEFVLPVIPDYVDGSFRTDPADGHAVSEAGHAPAARHAA